MTIMVISHWLLLPVVVAASDCNSNDLMAAVDALQKI